MSHPGRTKAERRVLDSIGCGKTTPYMTDRLREKLLRDGLIVEIEPLILGHPPLTVRVRQFEMPTPVHMAWCASFDEAETAR